MIKNADYPQNLIFASGELCSYTAFKKFIKCTSNCVSNFLGNSSLFCVFATTVLTHQATYFNAYKQTEILIFHKKGVWHRSQSTHRGSLCLN